MWEYITKAATAWFLGFFPFLEIYVAIPASIALGLDYVSVVFWCVLGNYMPVPMIVAFHSRLRRVPRIGPWLDRLATGRGRRILHRHGPMFVLFATPWIGIWAVAAAAQTLGMHRGKLLFYSFASVAGYGIILTIMIALGLDWFSD
ncbi:MAG: small multi-drug export protein [Phycisphaeraceae bacterium]